ncbi:6978_t:CDS:10 [Ambispora leptoticha]|uniref:Autophagy-related protein 2 n=1 Tax=Ambispora leptoticha TaxID=144679 RepID=A0A9N8YVV0_9GLOM|nr:6978_t:CDS:10 [Ambispora leptoticha]
MYSGWPFSWKMSIIPQTIQKRLLKFLLKKAIGQFLTDELDLDNLDVEFGKGHIHLKELQLNTEVLNDLVADLPIIITDGRIGGIIANIPWKNIWNSDCVLEIHNLKLVIVPEQVKPKNAKSSTEDSHILSSSIHFAGDFLRHGGMPSEEGEELRNSIYQSFHSSASEYQQQDITNSLLDNSETLTPQPLHPQQTQNIESGGVELLARLIDKIMSNVKVIFKDTLIRLQHKSNYSLDGRDDGLSSHDSETLRNYFFDLEIPTISYRDETEELVDGDGAAAGTESSVKSPPTQFDIIKSLTIQGLKAWIREQGETLSSLPPSSSLSSSTTIQIKRDNPDAEALLPYNLSGASEYGEMPEIPDGQESSDEFYGVQANNEGDGDDGKKLEEKVDSSSTESNTKLLYEAMIFTCGEHENFGRVTVKQNSPPPLQFDTNNASSSYMYTQEAIQQASSTQTWDFNCNIQSIVAVLTPGQVGLFVDLMNALSASKIAGHERKITLNTERDIDSVHQDISRMQMPPTSSGGGSRSSSASMRSPLNSQDRSDASSVGYRTKTISSFRARSKQNIGNDPYYQTNIEVNNNFYELPLGEQSVMYSEYSTTSTSSTKYPQTFKTTSYPNSSQNPYTTTSSPFASTTLPTTTTSSTVPSTNLDITLNISLIEFYLLYKNDSIPGRNFFDNRTPEQLNMDHLKFEVKDFTTHLLTCEPEAGTNVRRRSLNVSSSNGSFSSGIGGGGHHYHHQQKILDSEQKPKISLEISISDLSVLEWLEGFVDNSPSPVKGDILPPFRNYNRVLCFDPTLLNPYDADDAGFLCFPVSQKKFDSSNRPNSGGSGGSKHSNRGMVNMIRVKIDIQNQENEGNNNSATLQSSTPSLNVDLQPFHLHFDLRLIDRLENYIRIVDSINNAAKSSRDEETASRGGGIFTEMHSESQHIIDDLDAPRVTELSSHQSRVRIHCERIRAWIICPDLNCSDSEEDKEANNYRIRSDLLVADIDQIDIVTGGSGSGSGGILQNQSLSRGSNFSADIYGLQGPSNLSTADLQNRVKIEFVSINVFLKCAQDSEAKCFLLIKTFDSHPTSHQRTLPPPNCIPNVELTFRQANTMANQLFYEGSGFPASPFSQTYASYEGGEERVNWPMENEEEDILRFKQRTIESSLFVLNCYFPVTRVRISKSLYDTLQILLNDLSLWQPNFTKSATTTTISGSSSNDDNNNTNALSHSMYKSNMFVSDGFNENIRQNNDYIGSNSEMRRRMGGGSIDGSEGNFNIVKPSLASLVVLMANVEIDILCEQESESADVKMNVYQLNMSELRFFAAIKHQGKNDTYLCLDNDDFTFLDITNSQESSPLLCRTISKGIKTKNTRPMISIIIFSSLDDGIGIKETNLTLSINGITLRFDSLDPKWPQDLARLFQGPELIPYVDIPTHTKLIVSISESSIDYIPKDIPARMVVVLENLKASSTLMLDVPLYTIKLISQNTDLFVVDDVMVLNEKLLSSRLGNGVVNAKKYWKTVGLAHAANVNFADISLRINKGEIVPKFEIILTNETLTIETCADSFHTLLSLINHIASNNKSPENKPEKHPKATSIPTNVFDNLDEEAFKPPSSTSNTTKEASVGTSDLTIMDEYYSMDDSQVITPNENNMVYKDEFNDVPKTLDFEESEESDGSEESEELGDKECGILLMDKEMRDLSLNLVENYFSIPTASELEEVKEDLPKSLTRIRIRDFNLVWKLYDGYDWEETRTTVSENIAHAKSQAKQQSADSAETVTGSDPNSNRPISPLDSEASSFFDRLYMGPTYRHSDYEGSSQAASEIDYTVDDRSDISSLVGSGLRAENEHLSRRDSGSRKTADPSRSTRSRPKLGRSKASKLDIRLEKMNLEFDIFPEDDQLAFRLLLSVRDVEILDNIKTSAWRKFLSHMRAENDTSPRETKSNMVRIELQCVRPVPTEPSEEFRLKTRLLPLRFHIDQDALNFIIRFFSFQATSSKIPVSKSEDDTYIQYFEIQPIIMKIDYKPKHIDYTNLKEGNLVELMNFFHFDSADMTLSSVKLRGVKGWKRLFEELGAAWLPYIKNTQVPNVVSGVAPIRSLVNLGSGVADLILLPIEQYKKDGRIVRGIEEAYKSLQKNLGTAAHTIFAVPMEVYEKTGTQGSVKAVIRAVPVAVLKPMIGASEAISKTLLGLRNTIDPNKLPQMEDKYKKPLN